jgi:hypothetical protein
MAKQPYISLVERQRCSIEPCVQLRKSGSETLQHIHQAYGDDAMTRAAVFKWWKRFRDGEMNVNTSAGKVKRILFFDAKGIILQHCVPPGQTVSGRCYATVLRMDFRNAIR